MHKRGYRTDIIHKAALKETLAAGLLLISGWDKLIYHARYIDELPAYLLDPMMGSGTFLLEAALIASDIAPGLFRYQYNSLPPALRWYDSDLTSWNILLKQAQHRATSGTDWLRH